MVASARQSLSTETLFLLIVFTFLNSPRRLLSSTRSVGKAFKSLLKDLSSKLCPSNYGCKMRNVQNHSHQHKDRGDKSNQLPIGEIVNYLQCHHAENGLIRVLLRSAYEMRVFWRLPLFNCIFANPKRNATTIF
jgi:hypothetical protein